MYYTIQSVRPIYPNELYHHGVKGQKWGVRRFQNPDGTLTAAGKKRYNTDARGRDYRNLRADTVKTGMVYSNKVRAANSARDRYNRAVDKGASTQKLDKLRAKKKDAEASEKFWKSQNKNSLDAVLQSRAGKAARGKLKEEKVSKIPTRTLKNGEKILTGNYLNSRELRNTVLAGLFLPGVRIGPFASAPSPFIPLSAIGYASTRPDNYRYRIEKESNFKKNKNYDKYKERKKSGYYKNK